MARTAMADKSEVDDVISEVTTQTPRAKARVLDRSASADKPEFVDLMSEAARQNRRRVMPRVVKQEKPKAQSLLSNWPPARWEQWRLATFTPWRMKSWKFKDWD